MSPDDEPAPAAARAGSLGDGRQAPSGGGAEGRSFRPGGGGRGGIRGEGTEGGTLKTATRKLRPPIKRHGGKAYLARRIVALMPPHRTYVEPYLGGGSVLLNKPPAEREVAGDVDAGLMGFWSVLAADGATLADHLSAIAYSGSAFEHALENRLYGRTVLFDESPPSAEMVRAINFLVRNRFSRGGLGKTFAWSDRLRGGQPGDANAWETIRAELPAIAERVKNVEFHCCDALQLIRANDGPDTLFYCDPPYLHETRTVRDAYEHEMDRAAHEALLATLILCRGKVMLSGYRNALYDEALTGWRRVEFDMPNHSGQGKTKQRRVECLWTNFDPMEAS
jgi:DNA adenine methylase